VTSEPGSGGTHMGRRRFIQAAAALASGVALSAAAGDPRSAEADPSRVLRPQALALDATLDPELAAVIRRGHQLPAADRGDLLVLSYHQVVADVLAPRKVPNPFSVTASQLAAHLTMLRSIGFRPVRLADVVRARRVGATLPPRSVLLTFDDGSAGQWTHGDAVLRRTGFSAVTFLITGYVGSAPEFATWDEVRAMVASGRWEIGDHTHRDHHKVPTGPSMVRQSALINRTWDPRTRTLETLPAAETRVRTDLDLSLQVLHLQRLPRPLAFAYPFSRVDGPTNDHVLTEYTEELAARLFPLRFANVSPGRLVTSADLALGLLPRFEVHHHVTALELYEVVRAASLRAVTPAERTIAAGLLQRGGADPLGRAGRH
jgi:peptidoglycan/xylan/chitin deacetylase (PgdA/CDA1 family)